MSDDVEEYRKVLQQHLAACDKTTSTAILRGRMFQFCLPAGLSLYTTAGVLNQIAELLEEPNEWADEDKDEDDDE